MPALPAECDGFLTSRRTRLAAVWGGYGLKHAANVLALCWSPDGGALLTHHHGSFSLWDAATGEELWRFAAPGRPRDVAFTPDGQRVVFAALDAVSVVDVAAPHAHRVVVRHPRHPYALALTADGARVAVSVWDGTVRVYDLTTGAERAVFQASGAACFTPDGRALVARTPDDGATLHPLDGARPRTILDPRRRRSDRWAFSPDGGLVALGFHAGGGLVVVRDLATGKVRWQAEAHDSGITSLAFSRDGRALYTTAWRGDGFRVWDAASGARRRAGRPFAVSDGSSLAASRVVYSPDRTRAAVLSADEELRLVDLHTLTEIERHTGHRCCVSAVAFVSAERAVTASYDRTLRVWDVARGVTTLTLEASAAEVAGGHRPELSYGDGSDAVWQYASGDAGPRDLALTPDRRTALTAGPGDGVRAWDLATATERDPWRGHVGVAHRVAMSRDGALAVSVGDDGTARVWDATRAAAARTLRVLDGSAEALALTPSGRRVVLGGDYFAQVVEVATGEVAASFEDDGELHVTAAAWLQDESAALLGGWIDGQWQVLRWDIGGDRGGTVLEFTGRVTALALSPDGSLGAAASEDGSLRLWDVASDAEVDVIALDRSLDYATALAFAPDGGTLLVGTRRGVVLRFELVTRA